MKNILYISLFLATCILASCSGNKEKTSSAPSAHEVFASSLTGQDTAVIKRLCEDFLDAMKTDEKDIAFSILRRVNEDGDIVEPSNEQLAKISAQFTMFPVIKYVLKDFKIGDETNNICSYSIIFNIDETGKESSINFGFCPVKRGKEWYITARNASSEIPQ